MKRVPFLFSIDTPMAERLRTFAWAGSPIGEPAGWDTALKTLVPMMLASNQPMCVVWGPSRTLLYNDAYAELLGDKHPGALGRDFLEVWDEVREEVAPLVADAYRGIPSRGDDVPFWTTRHGQREETHFSYFFAPVRAESGEVAGFLCGCNDHTRRVLAERELAESGSRHRSVLEHMDEGFMLFDRDFTIVEVNQAAVDMAALDRDALVGHCHWDVFPGTFDAPLGRMYRRVLAEGRGESMENHYVYADGREAWYEIRAFPVRDGLALVYRDITARRHLREEADAARRRIQLALEAGAIIGTWMWDIQADVFIGDELFAASFGLDPSAVSSGLPLEQVADPIHPDDRPRVEAAIAEALTQRGQYRCQYRVLRGGSYCWVEARGRVEVDADGNPAWFPGVLLDIEDRRRIEAERDRAASLLETFIDVVPGVVYAKDREGRFLLVNRGTAELVGLPPGDILGRTDAELLQDPVEAADIMALDQEIMATGTGQQKEEAVRRPGGTPAVFWSTKEPLRDTEGRVIGLVGTSVDITDRKRMLEALRDADRRKDEFLAMLAHELRNPLAPISTASHILKLSAGNPVVAKETGEVIARQVGHLTRLVDDLLDVSRVTRGLVELDRQPVDLRTVVSTAIEQVQPLLQSRRHELGMKVGTGPFIVEGDFHRLVQIVSNLLNNAAKYTPQGGTIDVDLHGRDGQAWLTVADNGIGISPGMLPHIFELFAQAERTPDRSQGGLGIGLSLVRSLVQLHGGSVQAASPGLHQGSIFSVSLPLTTASGQPDTKPHAERTGGKLRILLVDDNVDAATTLAAVLTLSGHDVETAGDARSALVKASGEG
ncbi:MAG TPA: PAS domain-containing protein, partial [Lysobacter sp.]|nr:PAS domain-containing protein [Lysobacter sp.]